MPEIFPVPDALLGVHALAARLGYTAGFLYKLRCVAPDRLPPPLSMPGRPRWSSAAVDAWIAERTVKATPAAGRRGAKSTAAKARAERMARVEGGGGAA